ncbi:TonB-dependent receptor plug domain-containing protein [Croceicoccus sediminis]|uniref:TonB-dependent receptor plug domain-containing protein n=1 Tax=Croceicoccus sediminis TaxID=2571150 RepID=UPI001479747A|nr:TonB-dependent receptor [Croceicoccus sediminis]
MRKNLSANLGALLGTGSLIALCLPAAALAQDAGAGIEPDTQSDPIVVTGSRIRGIDPVGSPVIGLSRDDIEQSTASTTTELLSELPQVFNFGASEASFTSANNQNANRTFGTGINLRGLGAESTLTLLDGRRLPAAGTQSQFFDPSVIPTMAISRLEVLADGSSGIYGSDAVGGVVNILLRKNFDGAEAMGRVRLADGFEEYQLGAAIGKTWGTGSIMVAGEYNDRGALAARERDFYTDDFTPFGGPDLRSLNSAPGNVTVGGVNYAIPDGDGTNLTAGDFVAGTRNLQSAYLGVDALPAQERYSVATTFQQAITDGIEFYAQGFYAKRKGVLNRTALTAQFDVPESNPFYVNPGAPGERVTVSYSFINELGNERAPSSQEAYHITGGLNAELGSGWSGNAFYAYGHDKERSLTFSLGSGPAGAALAAALADPDPATAFNPFSSTGNNNPATIASFVSPFRVDTDYGIQEYGLSVDGPLFALPAGDVRVALGAARQEINFQDLAPFQTNFDRKINSVFGEVFLPILGGDGPELNVSAAGRYDDYNDVGDTFNPKFGVTFRPVDSLTLRGSYGTSFRAPTLSDTGLPFNQYRQFIDANGDPANVLFLRGGNPGLAPEEATTWSLGADWKPDSVPGLSLSVTYYNVDYTNRIATPGNDFTALQNPDLAPIVTYNPSLDVVNAIIAGGLFSAPPASPSDVDAIVDGRKVNLGANKTDGLEFIGSYEADADWGAWRIGFNATKILSFDRSIISGTPLQDVLDTINNPASFIARAYAGADVGNFSATVYANHYGSYDNNTVTPVQDVPSHTEFDLALRLRVDEPSSFADGITFSLDVQDIFDNDPPYVPNGNLAFDPNAHSAIGRTVAIGVRVGF